MPASLPADDDALLELGEIDAGRADEEGLFAHEGWLRRVSGEPVVLFGGVRALLLEVADPLVAAGVAEHSDFRHDPFGRLQRTLAAMTTIVFSTRSEALAAARGVARSHERVVGCFDRQVGDLAAGTPYHGRDPELVLWVWATLADTALAVYEAFVGALDAAARAEYHRDQRRLALLLGAPPERTPGDPTSFRSWFDARLDTLCVAAPAREIARSVLTMPGADRGPVPLVTGALLPARLREAFGVPWDASREAAYAALITSVRALRPPARVDAPEQGG